MKKINCFKIFLTLFAMANISAAFAQEGKISKINLLPSKDSAVLILNYEGKGSFRVLHSEEKASVVVEVTNLSIPVNLTKAINIATSGSPVLEATPYSSSNGKQASAKIILQLKENVEISKSEGNGRFILEMKRKSQSSQNKFSKSEYSRSFAH